MNLLGRWSQGRCEAVHCRNGYTFVGNGPTLEVYQIKPGFYEKMFRGKELLQVVMAGMENGTPTIIVMAFESSISPSGELKINVKSRPCPGIACPSSSVYIFMGEHDDIDRYLLTDPGILKDNPVDVIQKLIEIEVTSKPETVGPPINILRITKGGSEWIQENNTCVDPSLSK